MVSRWNSVEQKPAAIEAVYLSLMLKPVTDASIEIV